MEMEIEMVMEKEIEMEKEKKHVVLPMFDIFLQNLQSILLLIGNNLSIYLFITHSLYLSIYLSIHHSLTHSIYLSIYLYIYLHLSLLPCLDRLCAFEPFLEMA